MKKNKLTEKIFLLRKEINKQDKKIFFTFLI